MPGGPEIVVLLVVGVLIWWALRGQNPRLDDLDDRDHRDSGREREWAREYRDRVEKEARRPTQPDTEVDHYGVLGVVATAPTAVIRRAFAIQMHKHHPDKGGDPEMARRLNDAWSCLRDAERRAAYDAARAGDQGRPSVAGPLAASLSSRLREAHRFALEFHEAASRGSWRLADAARRTSLTLLEQSLAGASETDMRQAIMMEIENLLLAEEQIDFERLRMQRVLEFANPAASVFMFVATTLAGAAATGSGGDSTRV